MTAGALEDGVALLDKLACIVVFRGDGLLDLPIVAQGGKGVLFRLLAFGAGGELGTGDGTGGRGGVGFLPVVDAGGSCRAGTVDQVINRVVVCDGVPFGGGNLGDGDIFISVCNGGGVTGFQGYFVAPVRVVVAPVYNGDGGACCRVVEGVVCFVDYSGIIFYFGDLAVVSDYAVVSASDGGWAGGGVVGVGGYGGNRGYSINRGDTLICYKLTLGITWNTGNI